MQKGTSLDFTETIERGFVSDNLKLNELCLNEDEKNYFKVVLEEDTAVNGAKVKKTKNLVTAELSMRLNYATHKTITVDKFGELLMEGIIRTGVEQR